MVGVAAIARSRIDPRDAPAYPLAEAARYLHLPLATLRSWVVGRQYPRREGKGYFPPLIRAADADGRRLSFKNLIEAHVLRALRTDHGVSIQDVRSAIRFAERKLGIRDLLLNQELTTHAGALLIERYGELIDLSRSGQLAMRKLLEASLRRVEWDDQRLPKRLYPFLRAEPADDTRSIAIDPTVAFGRPFLLSRGVSTATIADRVDAGESVPEIARDYGLDPGEVEAAVVYERAA